MDGSVGPWNAVRGLFVLPASGFKTPSYIFWRQWHLVLESQFVIVLTSISIMTYIPFFTYSSTAISLEGNELDHSFISSWKNNCFWNDFACNARSKGVSRSNEILQQSLVFIINSENAIFIYNNKIQYLNLTEKI